MSEPRIGELRHLLQLKSRQQTSDGSGGLALSWSLVAEVWAAVRQVGGEERPEADRVVHFARHEIWMRPRAGVMPGMRLHWGARILEVAGVVGVGTPPRWLRCSAEERLP